MSLRYIYRNNSSLQSLLVTALNTPKRKLLILSLVALSLIALTAAGYFIIQNFLLKKSPSPQPTTSADNTAYVAGDVLVTFNKGTTYKQAKELFASLGITEYKNGYYEAMKIDLKDDVILDKGIFNLKTTPGKEDELINKLQNEKIVKTASKNYILHLTN